MGANCAHHFYPYWEGDVIPEYTEPDPIVVDGKEYTYYEATQEMRRQERNIRKTKRNMEAMNTLGEDTTELKKKGRVQEKAYLDFCKAAKINPRNYVLTVPYGTTKQPNQQQPGQQADNTKKNMEKPLTNIKKSSTIQSEMNRKIDRSRSREEYNFISEKRFNDITAPARKNGAIIMRGSEEVEKHLDKTEANASSIGDVMLFREKVTASEALEETRHFEQNRIGLNADLPHDLRDVLNEIDAKEYILNNAEKYDIPRIEIDETNKFLEAHKKELERLRDKYNV